MKRRSLIALYVILVLLSAIGIYYEIYIYRNKSSSKKIAYQKQSNLNYVTYLKDNKFFNSAYLEDDYNYVASLVDYFNVDFNYYYTASEKIDYVLTYDIKAVLEVYDNEDNSKPIGKDEYVLYPKTTESGKKDLIKVEIFNHKIEYQKYKEIVNEWKKEVSPDAYLTVYYNVSWTGKADSFNETITDNYSSVLKIPISDKIININKPAPVLDNNYLRENVKMTIMMKVLLCSTILLLISSLARILMFILENSAEKDKYEQKINKLLREFDRAITEAKGSFKKQSKDHNIEVKDFLELMDVHDNLNVPIVYYKNSKTLSYFIVRNEKDVYIYKMSKNSFTED